MRKVLFLVPSLGMGGLERVLVNYANLFSKRGYNVTVLNYTSHDDAIIANLDDAVHYKESFIPVPHFLHAKWRDLLHFNFRILPWQKWINFHSAKYLHKKYVTENYDIEIGFGGINTFKVVAGVGDIRTKSIGWIHGIHIENDIKTVGSFSKTKEIYDALDAFVCVSQQCTESLKTIYDRTKNVFVINNPNDTKQIRKLAEQHIGCFKNTFTFVTVGRFIDQQKGFIRLLDVCKRLNDEGFSYNIWLVGDGPDLDLVKNKAREYKLDNVVFWGKQSNPYAYINQADMYLCTSYTEGFSMVMMEAIILAKPMLTTNVSGASEMLDSGKYGMIVENSEDGLYRGMKEILTHPEVYNEYCIKAVERKDYLSEDEIMNKLEKVIWRLENGKSK